VLRIREAIVVEGRYDRSKLKQLVDAPILETHGFGVFKDGELLSLLRRLAGERGLIVLTDSDGAGFVIRSFLKGSIPPGQVKHAYIPDVYGKERRKRAPGREGKLGVEGMTTQVLEEALRRAGATFLPESGAGAPGESGGRGQEICKADLFAWGLSGTSEASRRRQSLLKKLSLPEHMSANALLEALNALYTREEISALLLKGEGELDGAETVEEKR